MRLDAKKGANMNRKRLALFVVIILASIIVGQARAQQATVSVVPASQTVPTVGSSFAVNVTVQNVEDLYGYELKLYYPNNVLNGTSVTQGSFLEAGGSTPLFFILNFTDNYNVTYGRVWASCTLTGATSGVNGTGTLLTVTFVSTSTSGSQALHLTDVKLANSNVTAIPFTAVDGEVTVIPELSTVLILPLLVASTIMAVVLRKKNR
jgi:hypothetical protein